MDRLFDLFNSSKPAMDNQTPAVGVNYETEREKYEQFQGITSRDGSYKYSTELENTPLFTLDAKYRWNAKVQLRGSVNDYQKVPFPTNVKNGPFAQSALLGFHIGDHEEIGTREPIMLNTSAPNSTFICGSQGSGKSYTLSCVLENFLLPDEDYGYVSNPVAGVAFNYDSDSGNSLAEVASLCSRGIKVKVLVSASNFHSLKKKYERIPGANEHLTVDTLAFKEWDLDIAKMYKLMAFAETGNGTPLYEQVIGQVLREMGMSNERFNMKAFEAKPEIVGLDLQQKKMFDQRVVLLKSYLAGHIKHGLEPKTDIFRTKPGELTVVDLTDPFINGATACTLFDIALSLFKQQSPKDGLVVVLDEAHRYMDESAAAQKFTESLLTTIRMQRHSGTRVIVATQEPTISERLLDLCSTSIVHRFNSPAWFKSIKEHLAGASSLLASDEDRSELFGSIVELDVGEAFVLSPSSFVCVGEGGEKKLGFGCMRMKTRSRKGIDSGKTMLAGDPSRTTTDDLDSLDEEEERGDGKDVDEKQRDDDTSGNREVNLAIRKKPPFSSKKSATQDRFADKRMKKGQHW